MLVGTKAISGLRAGEFLEIFDDYSSHLDHVWNVIFEALARTPSNRSFREFKADCIYPLNFITPVQFRFEESVVESLGKNAWSGVTRLQLNLTTSFGARDRNGVNMAIPTVEEGYPELSAFAESLPNLDALDLCFDSRMGSSLICQSFLSHTNVSRFTSLRLAGLFIDAASLAGIMAGLEKVRELGLETTNLNEGSWLTVLQEITRLPHLDHLDLMHLRQAGHACSFPKQLKRESADADDDAVCPKRAEYCRLDNEGSSDSDPSDDSSDDSLGSLYDGRTGYDGQAEYDGRTEYDGLTESSPYITEDDSLTDQSDDSSAYLIDDSSSGISDASSTGNLASTAYASSTASAGGSFETEGNVNLVSSAVYTGRTGEGVYYVSFPAVRDRDERRICLQGSDVHVNLQKLIKYSYSLDKTDTLSEVYGVFLVNDVANHRAYRLSGFHITPIDVFRTVVRSIESP